MDGYLEGTPEVIYDKCTLCTT